MDRYIGIKKRTIDSPSTNEGLIFEKREDEYVCINCGFIATIRLTEENIQHDVQKGYLKLYDGE